MMRVVGVGRLALRTSRAAPFLVAHGPPALALVQLREMCTAKKAAGESGTEGEAGSPAAGVGKEGGGSENLDGQLEVSREGMAGGGSALMEHEGENLPPLEFEPGAAGVAQKGVSAVVIAFGAAAFGAIAWGTYQALFPGASSTGAIYSEAFEKVQQDPKLSAALGTPLHAHGSGGNRGRRNTMERWEVVENGEELSVVRFTVGGPNGSGDVVVQTPKSRSRGEFKYIIFETPHPRGRAIYHVYDGRSGGEDEAAAAAAAPAPIAPAAEAAVPPPPAPIAPAAASA